ncbi:MAG: hypothetical protein ACI9B9_002591 [Halioglobus sp.]|jgi:hypothetical protein
MNDEQYMQHCRAQFKDFALTLKTRTQELPDDDPLRELALGFCSAATGESNLYEQAPILVSRLFATYPDFAPTYPRELLWFFGGDCLHLMADQEIVQFQQLDTLREHAEKRGEVLDFEAARAKLMKSL